jgi:hypothetical protein
MAGKRKPQGEIILEYLRDYPEWFPRAELARLIVKENPAVFDDPESVRALIRYHVGQLGDRTRKKDLSVKEFLSDKRKSSPFAIPPTWSEEKKIVSLPSGLKKVGLIGDLQVPFHDPKAIDCCFNYLLQQGIDSLLINGDLVDFMDISDYEKDPRKRDFEGEYDTTIAMLIFIKQVFPEIPIYYNLSANHEYRWERYMRKKAPELLGLKLFEIEDLLKLDDIGIKYFKNIDHIKVGKLPVIHGDTVFSRGSGVYPARTLWLRTKVSTLANHVHRTSSYTDKNFKGEMMTCWTVGMLAHPNMDYCKHTDSYNQGFAIINKETGGNYEVDNYRILNGRVLR